MGPSKRAPAWAAGPPAAPAIRGGRAALLGTLALVLSLVAAAHWPVLGAQAVSMDDNAFVKNNPLVTRPGWSSTVRFFSEVLHPSTVPGYYLPLTMTSLMVDHALGGRPDDLRVFHRTSLALHLLNTALLMLLLIRLFGGLLPAAVVGLLFGLHPLTVEPVAWVGERKTLLAACFALAAMLAHLAWLRDSRRAWRATAVACFALALLAKPTVAPLPLLLLALDAWPLRRLSVRTVIEKWPFFVLAGASALITVISHERSADLTPATAQGVLHWPLHAGYLLGFYLGKILVPLDLTCVYPPPAPLALSNPVVAASVATVVALGAVLLLVARRTLAPLVGAAFFALAIAPTLGLVQYSWVIASDKYVYFPAVGPLIALGGGLAVLWSGPRAKGWLAALALPLVLVLGAEAYGVRVTLRHWKDTPALFHHMERLAPGSPAVMNGLALIAIAESRPEDALRHLKASVAIEPRFADTRYNLGLLLAGRGELAEAVEHLRQADAIQPDDPDILGALGASLRASGQGSEGIAFLRRAVNLKPDFQPAVLALGQALVQGGETAEGATVLRRAVALNPDDPMSRYQLAAALIRGPGGDREAGAHLRRALESSPDEPMVLNTLAWLLATSPDTALRRPAEARRLAGRAMELSQALRPEVLDTYAAALAADGDLREAARVAGQAVRLAREGGAEALARDIESRLRLYRAGSAYVSPPDPEPEATP